MKIEDFNFDNILLDQKSHEVFPVYDTSNKTLIDAEPLIVRFDKVDGFIKETRYLVLFGAEK